MNIRIEIPSERQGEERELGDNGRRGGSAGKSLAVKTQQPDFEPRTHKGRKKYLYIHIYSYTTHSNQEMEPGQRSVNK